MMVISVLSGGSSSAEHYSTPLPERSPVFQVKLFTAGKLAHSIIKKLPQIPHPC